MKWDLWNSMSSNTPNIFAANQFFQQPFIRKYYFTATIGEDVKITIFLTLKNFTF